MSDTLAFLIDAPLQSWGASSRFQRRETESWPTKSALVGVLAAALGIDKHAAGEAAAIAPLAALVLTVLRWEKQTPGGRIISSLRLSDYHTIGGGWPRDRKGEPWASLHVPIKAKRTDKGQPIFIDGPAVETTRTYLTESRFIAIFQGERATLEKCAAALGNPVWGVWFGRKACLPASPLCPLVADSLPKALATLATRLGQPAETFARLEGVTEAAGDGTFFLPDQPLAFGQHHGPLPEPYGTRPVRRLAPGELP